MKLRHSKAWYQRQFAGPRDFKISDNLRDHTGISTMLPFFIDGQEAQTLDLMELGNAEAARQGISNPTCEDAVRCGLYAAAKLTPMPEHQATEENAPRLVRAALLDSDRAATNVSDEELQRVVDRFANLVEPHLADDLDQLTAWYCGPSNSLVRQIANQRKSPGGRLEQERVTAALSELGWRSLLQAEKCIEVQMRCVAADLPAPLSTEDRLRFELLYYRQSCFGGVSLCVLSERFGFLREAVWDVLKSPQERMPVRVLLRMLQYYATLASQRRDFDRQRRRLSIESKLRQAIRPDKRRNSESMLNHDDEDSEPFDGAFEA